MASEIHFRRIGSGHSLSPPSLMLSYDGNKCLINVGENVQRYCFEHKVRLSRLRTVLLTEVSVETVGGLPGLLLTLSGIGTRILKIVGPKPIMEYLLAFGYRAKGLVESRDNSGDAEIKTCLFSVNHSDFLDCQRGENCSPETKTELEIEVVELGLGVESNREGGDHGLAVKFDLGEGIKLDSYILSQTRSRSSKRSASNLNKKMCTDTPPFDSQFPGDGCSIVYFFEFPDKKGKFDVNKAKSLGIPPGPLYSELKDGRNITLPDSGKVVFSRDVCLPPIKLPWVMITSLSVNCGARKCFHAPAGVLYDILESRGFSFIDKESVSHGLGLESIFYIFSFREKEQVCCCGDSIDSSHITNRDNSLGGQIRLVRLGCPVSCLNRSETNPFVTSHLLQEFLNGVAPLVFPRSNLELNPSRWNDKFIVSHNGRAKLSEKPSCSGDDKNAPSSLSIMKRISKLSPIDKGRSQESLSTKRLEELRDKFSSALPDNENKYPRLCVLGTGSAIPSPYRNVSGNLLMINENINVLLDCGEGSLFQLFVLLGCDVHHFQRVVNSTSFVFISHPHEDHFLGLFKFIKTKYFWSIRSENPCRTVELRLESEYNSESSSNHLLKPRPANGALKFSKKDLEHIVKSNQTVVIGPRNIEKILNLCISKVIPPHSAESDRLKSKIVFIPTSLGVATRRDTNPLNSASDPESEPNGGCDREDDATPTLEFQPFPVRHIRHSFGVKISLRSDGRESRECFRIVFSGDTVPCQSLETASKDCDVLIHEATFEDSLEEEARRKNHSTLSGAIGVAMRSSAKSLLLTHFSQRYQNTPMIEEEESETSQDVDNKRHYYNNNTLLLMDLMVLPLRSICALAKPLHLLNKLVRDNLP